MRFISILHLRPLIDGNFDVTMDDTIPTRLISVERIGDDVFSIYRIDRTKTDISQ